MMDYYFAFAPLKISFFSHFLRLVHLQESGVSC